MTASDAKEPDRSIPAETALNILSGVVGGLVAGSSGPLAPVTGPAAAAAAQGLTRVSIAVWDHRRRRAERLLDAAAEMVGSMDILLGRALQNDDRVQLIARVLEAGCRSRLQAKIPALARVLADGIDDTGDVDEAHVLAAALDAIEGLHVTVLRHMDTHDPTPSTVEPGTRVWELHQLTADFPLLMSLPNLLAVLSAHGLVTQGGGRTFPGSTGPPSWSVNELGRRCLYLLRQQ